jgi:hypothetical protein
VINLVYIRAAIRENTGRNLSLDKVLQYLVEEGLVTPEQAADKDLIFRGYSEYFDMEEAAARTEPIEQLIDKEFFNEIDESQVRGI